MTDEEKIERQRQLNVGVRKDGTVEGYNIETYLAYIYAIKVPNQYGFNVDHVNKFISFTIDNGGVDSEVRLPFEVVEWFKGWIDCGPNAAPDQSPSNAEAADDVK